MLLKPAGTRPEPAVSVPSAKPTRPAATATAEPELEPPRDDTRVEDVAGHAVRGALADRPVANWSRFVLPTTIAPASTRRCTHGRRVAGDVRNAGQAAVVGSSKGVDVVLDREGDAEERKDAGAVAPGLLVGAPLEGARRGQQLGARQPVDLDLGRGAVNPPRDLLGDRDRGGRARAVGLRQRRQVETQLVHGAFVP